MVYQKPPISSSCPAPQPTHSRFLSLAFACHEEYDLLNTEGLSSHWWPTGASSATYFVGDLVLGSSGRDGVVWLFDIVVLPMRSQTPSPPSVLSLTSPSAYLSAVTEPLRRQLYQAPVSKIFLASTIVSGFGGCLWDGSPGRAVSWWSFLQSLLRKCVAQAGLELVILLLLPPSANPTACTTTSGFSVLSISWCVSLSSLFLWSLPLAAQALLLWCILTVWNSQ
jgi:hypothetical protein